MTTKKTIDSLKDILKKEHDITQDEFKKILTIFNNILEYNSDEGYMSFEKEKYYFAIVDKLILVYYTKKIQMNKAINCAVRDMGGKYEWGIVFGREGICLLNSSIKTGKKRFAAGKIVFMVSFSGKTDSDYLKFFSFENMFGRYRNTYFFRDMITYKNMKFKGDEKSWQAYHSAMKRFFSYYVNSFGEWRENVKNNYDIIKLHHFESYIKDASKIKSPNTIKAQYFYVRDFILCMATQNEDFENGSDVILRMCADMPYDMRKGLRETDVEKIERIIDYFNEKKKTKQRTLFLLLLYFGIERRRLCELKWEDFSKDLKWFYLEKERRVKVPQILKDSLLKLREEEPRDAIYILGNVHSQNIKPISVNNINDMMSCIEKIDLQDDFYRKMTASNIRKWLFTYLLKQGYPLQDVLKRMNIPIANIGNYVNDEELWEYTSQNFENICPLEDVLKMG